MLGRMTQQQLDEPLASLEEHGLSNRLLNMLEDKLGAVYIRDLLKFDEGDLLGVDEFGVRAVEMLKRALLLFQEQSDECDPTN